MYKKIKTEINTGSTEMYKTLRKTLYIVTKTQQLYNNNIMQRSVRMYAFEFAYVQASLHMIVIIYYTRVISYSKNPNGTLKYIHIGMNIHILYTF